MPGLKSSCCGADVGFHREVDREKSGFHHTEYKDDYTCKRCGKLCEVYPQSANIFPAEPEITDGDEGRRRTNALPEPVSPLKAVEVSNPNASSRKTSGTEPHPSSESSDRRQTPTDEEMKEISVLTPQMVEKIRNLARKAREGLEDETDQDLEIALATEKEILVKVRKDERSRVLGEVVREIDKETDSLERAELETAKCRAECKTCIKGRDVEYYWIYSVFPTPRTYEKLCAKVRANVLKMMKKEEIER